MQQIQLPSDAIPLPDQPITGFKRWAVDTLLKRDKPQRVIRIELDIYYFMETSAQESVLIAGTDKNSDSTYQIQTVVRRWLIKQTHHFLEAVDSFLVDPQTMAPANEQTKHPVGEYTAYSAIIDSGAVSVPIMIAQSIRVADMRGRFKEVLLTTNP